MSDIVVTVPMAFTYDGAPGAKGLIAWLAEGDAPGDSDSGTEWAFTIGGCPSISPGERVYVVCEGRLVGYAPLVRLETFEIGGHRQASKLIRSGGAVSCTVPEKIKGFQGFRYRWWDRQSEIPLDLSEEIACVRRLRTEMLKRK